MQIITDLQFFPEQFCGGVLSIGKFDGMHLGHSLIINRLKNHANNQQIPTIILTFDPLPITVLRPDGNIQPICTLERKIELFHQFNLDALVVLRTDHELLNQSAETFFFETLRERLKVTVIVEGHNFCFGHDRLGTSEVIRQYGQQTGITIDIVEPVRRDNQLISSSGIRKLIREGLVEQAAQWMPQPYRLTGTVIQGDQRGRTLGFPTANLGKTETIIPKSGIYATIATFDGQSFESTTHIGTNPTFQQSVPKIEVFVHHFDGDLYDKKMDIDFFAMLREVIRFESVEELIQQMNHDIQQSHEILIAKRKSF
ncbi:MAG: bifunctional riboflavin kinase/FAD synthetase [Planctomycetaceae bacterium]|jgi:riboflavin kinase/FMN adenylyltransferase|nr:bifunctional riboflavin kinase/FAD synthetase [Planctomycetaceae bacterium]